MAQMKYFYELTISSSPHAHSKTTTQTIMRDVLIALLPALPSDPAWASGKVSGLCARGGYRVDITWESGRVVRFSLYSAKGGDVTVRVNGKDHTYRTEAGQTMDCEPST